MLKSRTYLKSKFKNGDRPNQLDFFDLIDSSLNLTDDILSKTSVGLSNVDDIKQLPFSYMSTSNVFSADDKIPTQLAVKSFVEEKLTVINAGTF